MPLPAAGPHASGCVVFRPFPRADSHGEMGMRVQGVTMGKGHRASSSARMTHRTCFLGLSHPTAGLGPGKGQGRPNHRRQRRRQRGNGGEGEVFCSQADLALPCSALQAVLFSDIRAWEEHGFSAPTASKLRSLSPAWASPSEVQQVPLP